MPRCARLGDATGARSGPLAKRRGTTTHILRLAQRRNVFPFCLAWSGQHSVSLALL
jgi:hypothetical protein